MNFLGESGHAVNDLLCREELIAVNYARETVTEPKPGYDLRESMDPGTVTAGETALIYDGLD